MNISARNLSSKTVRSLPKLWLLNICYSVQTKHLLQRTDWHTGSTLTCCTWEMYVRNISLRNERSLLLYSGWYFGSAHFQFYLWIRLDLLEASRWWQQKLNATYALEYLFAEGNKPWECYTAVEESENKNKTFILWWGHYRQIGIS